MPLSRAGEVLKLAVSSGLCDVATWGLTLQSYVLVRIVVHQRRVDGLGVVLINNISILIVCKGVPQDYAPLVAGIFYSLDMPSEGCESDERRLYLSICLGTTRVIQPSFLDVRGIAIKLVTEIGADGGRVGEIVC
jgi:hypothetical protein